MCGKIKISYSWSQVQFYSFKQYGWLNILLSQTGPFSETFSCPWNLNFFTTYFVVVAVFLCRNIWSPCFKRRRSWRTSPFWSAPFSPAYLKALPRKQALRCLPTVRIVLWWVKSWLAMHPRNKRRKKSTSKSMQSQKKVRLTFLHLYFLLVSFMNFEPGYDVR